jgi:hypothetical protein
MKTHSSDLVSRFETHDINLASTLCAFGAVLQSIDRDCGDRCAFVFTNSKDTHQVVDGYWGKCLLIEPQALLAALRAIKSRLYGERL